MSGRDLRAFLSGHRNGTFHTRKSSDTLPHKYCAGSAPKITSVDYDHLLSDIQKHKDEVHAGLQRFKKLSKKGKATKEASLLKKHHEIWRKEQTKLADLKARSHSEINQWRSNILSQGDSEQGLVEQLTLIESELLEETERFKELTLTPVWALKADLRNLTEDRSFPEADQSTDSTVDEILQELTSVREQQDRIQTLLQGEFEILESEVECFADKWGCSHGNSLVVKETDTFIRGVPVEVERLECPDDRLRSDTIKEFVRLDQQYLEMLDKWRRAHQHVIELQYGGWQRDEAESFSHLMDQHPASMANRRRLYLDRACRKFTERSREEIVAHETWQLSLHHYLSVRNNLLSSWAQHKEELTARVAILFDEAWRSCELKDAAKVEREEWRAKCERMYRKVQAWREEKVKGQIAVAEAAARQQALYEQQRKIEEIKVWRKREQRREQIRQYHSDIESSRRRELEQVRRVKEVAKIQRKKQALYNLERVDYRHERLTDKLAEVREVQEAAEREEREKEKRLDLLRQQVRVDVTFDPKRVQQATVASHARLTQPADINLQQPLYPLHSYPSDKITADPRVRLEAALREAGLHNTMYGRKVLLRVPPPQKPRPDQTSSLFKD